MNPSVKTVYHLELTCNSFKVSIIILNKCRKYLMKFNENHLQSKQECLNITHLKVLELSYVC